MNYKEQKYDTSFSPFGNDIFFLYGGQHLQFEGLANYLAISLSSKSNPTLNKPTIKKHRSRASLVGRMSPVFTPSLTLLRCLSYYARVE